MSASDQNASPLAAESELPAQATGRASALERKAASFLALACVLFGIALRLQRYALNRSFRNDEGTLASALNNHTWQSIVAGPISASVTAPPGFLLAEKLAVALLGNHDFVFRLVPLLAGLASVPLLYYLARQLIGLLGALFCVGAFAVGWMTVFYASDLKQYSSDVLFAIVIFLAAKRSFERGSLQDDLLLAAAGLLALPFSQPSIFILAALAPTQILHRWKQRPGRNRVVLIGLTWGLIFLVLYLVYYRPLGQTSYILNYWEDLNGLMPIPPWKDLGWFWSRPGALFAGVLGLLPFAAIPSAFYLLGLVSFARRGRWQWAALQLGSVLATLGGAAAASYPFKGRLILFLAPGALLVIGEGIQSLGHIARSAPVARLVAWAAVVVMLWAPASGMLLRLQEPRSTPYPEDIKPVLAHVQQDLQPDDIVVVYEPVIPTYTYYGPLYGLGRQKTYYLSDWRRSPGKYLGFIDALPRDRRVWFIFSRVLVTKDQIDERRYMLDYVRTSGGTIIEQFGVSGDISSAHLVVLK